LREKTYIGKYTGGVKGEITVPSRKKDKRPPLRMGHFSKCGNIQEDFVGGGIQEHGGSYMETQHREGGRGSLAYK